MAYLLLLIPLVTAAICFLPLKNIYWERASMIGGLATGLFAILSVVNILIFGKSNAARYYLDIDGLSAIFVFIIALIGTISCLYAVSYIRKDVIKGELEERRAGRFFGLMHLFIATMYLTVMAENLGVMWVSIEMTTIISALLVGYYGHKDAVEAAWKYIIICTVGIAFAMLGIILTYYATSTIVQEEFSLSWNSLYPVASRLDPDIMKLAFIFILVGYGTKAGLFPLHTWLPDAHSQAPSPVSALLSGVLINCAIYAIIRFHQLTTLATGTNYSSRLLIIFGIISMVGASPFILVQKDIKRLLAYSSVEHVGIIILGIGLGGVGGYTGALLHLINHALGKSTLFLCAGTMAQEYRTKLIQKMQGVGQLMPITGTVFFASLLAIGGAPPFGLFFSKMTIVSRGFQGYGVGLGVIFLLTAAVVFTGLIYFGGKMYFSDLPNRYRQKEPFEFRHVLLLIPICLLVLQGILMPDFVQNVIHSVVETILGGINNV